MPGIAADPSVLWLMMLHAAIRKWSPVISKGVVSALVSVFYHMSLHVPMRVETSLLSR